MSQWSRGIPARICILKARQLGMSTWTEALGFSEVFHRPNWEAIAVSKDDKSTNTIFRMTQLFQEEMVTEGTNKSTKASNAREIQFSAPHRSRFSCATAGSKGVGRSERIHFLHASEVAFWENAAEQLAGLYQVVPKNPRTCIVLESTANGVGGAFYDTFMNAVDRMRRDINDLYGYVPVFLPWQDFSEYRVEPPKSFEPSYEERRIQAQYDLTDSQVFWRHLKLDELNGDEALFKQEYPSTALEAFQSSGNPIFSQDMIRYQQKRLRGGFNCIFLSDDEYDRVDRAFNCWTLASEPKKGHQYSIGADTMEGRISDVGDVKSKLDCDGAVIFDRTDQRVVGIWRGRGDQGELGEQVYYAGIFYNEAWIAPEIPAGMTLLKVLKDRGYRNIFNRQIHDDRIDVSDSEVLGWRTTLVTRNFMVTDFLGVLRDKGIQVTFSEILDEMRTFIRDKQGKAIHMPGKHDDLLFALMIAIQVHSRCPLDHAELPAYTENEEDGRYETHLARTGAIDPGPDYDSWDDQEYTE